MSENRFESRCNELYKLGMKYNLKADAYIGVNEMINDFKVYFSEIYLDDESTWKIKIEQFRDEIKKRLE